MPKSIDLEAFLDKTFFAIDTFFLLSDIEDFIDFSESNIGWQKRREIHRTEIACADHNFDDPREVAQFRTQTMDGVLYRFEVSLTQRVRYAALVSLITTIEWVLLSLKGRSVLEYQKKPGGTSEAVYLLSQFGKASAVDLLDEIKVLETLVQVRNCIVHAAGLLGSYKHGQKLRERLTAYKGIRVSDINSLGDSIEIELNHLQCVVKDVKRWLPNLEDAMRKKGHLRE